MASDRAPGASGNMHGGAEADRRCVGVLHEANVKGRAMKIEYDPEVDALYIEFRRAVVHDNLDIEDGVAVAFDARKRVVGLEILDASSWFSRRARARIRPAGPNRKNGRSRSTASPRPVPPPAGVVPARRPGHVGAPSLRPRRGR